MRHQARRSGVSAPYRGSGQRPGSQNIYWDLKAIEHISITKITTVDTQNLMVKNIISCPNPVTKKLIANLSSCPPSHKWIDYNCCTQVE